MKCYWGTDTGMIRNENQDCVSVYMSDDGSQGVFVVCDGMGGANSGKLAAELASETFMNHVRGLISSSDREIPAVLTDAAEAANSKVYIRSLSSEKNRGMGTTLVGIVMLNGRATIVNVGDSRAYHVSGGKADRLTRDHSLVEDMVINGKITREQARTHPRKNLITRALGIDKYVESDIFEAEPKQGDCLILCSDGLSNMIRDEEFAAVASDEPDPEKAGKRLISIALERGAPDNVSVIVIYL